MLSRTLIFGTSYVSTDWMRSLVTLWAKVVCKLNPGCDVLLIDSYSPLDPSGYIESVKLHRFEDNIGHLSRGGKDGWGRAFCYGLDYAVEHDYRRVCYIDADLIFNKPVAPIFARMEKARVKVSCPIDLTYQFLENGLMFFDGDWLRESEFSKKYDWPSSKLTDLPERRCERLLGDDVWVLPLHGLRNDFSQLTFEGFDEQMPFGCDFLTHCNDVRLYQKMLESKGVVL